MVVIYTVNDGVSVCDIVQRLCTCVRTTFFYRISCFIIITVAFKDFELEISNVFNFKCFFSTLWINLESLLCGELPWWHFHWKLFFKSISPHPKKLAFLISCFLGCLILQKKIKLISLRAKACVHERIVWTRSGKIFLQHAFRRALACPENSA